MKNKRVSIKTIIIIVLVVIVIALISIIFNMKNNNIIKQEIDKEQLGEKTSNNSYVSMETHLSELSEKQKELDDMQNTAVQATVTEDKLLKDFTAYKDGKLITGTMANNGQLSETLSAGESYTIPVGYTEGGTITATDLASQTQGNATADNISKGKTAWVNGEFITGNGADNITLVSTSKNVSVTVPNIFNSVSVTATFSSLTKVVGVTRITSNSGTELAWRMLPKTFSVSGNKVTVTLYYTGNGYGNSTETGATDVYTISVVGY